MWGHWTTPQDYDWEAWAKLGVKKSECVVTKVTTRYHPSFVFTKESLKHTYLIMWKVIIRSLLHHSLRSSVRTRCVVSE